MRHDKLPRYGKPPASVAPELLFRRLLAFPRPSARLNFQFDGVEHEPLTVTALTAIEVAEADEASGDAALATIMARSLRAGGLFVFDGPSEVFELEDAEYVALLQAFFAVFFAICPVRGRCDWTAWSEALLKGASHTSNVTPATSLGGCFDAVHVGNRIRFIDRPERYWGCAPHDLTDGHIMCHAAARRLHEQRYSST